MAEVTLSCTEVDRLDIVERYLARRLDGAMVKAFERHYPGCSRCFQALERSNAIRAGFALLDTEPALRRQSRLMACPLPLILALAASAVFVVFGVHRVRVVALRGRLAGVAAQVTLPDYLNVALRGSASDSAGRLFIRAMQLYATNDYEAALPLLRAAVEADPSNPDHQFYLGATLLRVGRADDAYRAFQVSEREPALAADSRFYQAVAILERGDVPGAIRLIDDLIRTAGSRADDAEMLKRRIEQVTH